MTKRRSIDLIRTALGPSALLILLGACGSSAPTKQLVSARSAYQMAQASGAEQMAPNRFQDARLALDDAERAHKDDPGSNKEANMAYVAERKAQIAIASGKLASELQEQEQLNAQYQARVEQMSASQRAQMQQQQAAQLSEEEQAQALQQLGEVATVTQEHGRTVITLSDAALFPTGGDTLSDEARGSLDQVAQALSQQSPDTQIRVEGFTDSTGSAAVNAELSQRRADSVRDYLAQRGVAGSMLEAIGRGEADPVASNATEDGRASNRRAEIIVKLPQGQNPGGMPKQGKPNSSAKTPPEEQK